MKIGVLVQKFEGTFITTVGIIIVSCRLPAIQMSEMMVTIFIHISMHLYFHRRNFSTIFLQHLAIFLFGINTNSNSKVAL